MKPDMMMFPRWIKAALILTLLALLAGGAWPYRSQEQTMRHQVEEDLGAITRLKADQIAAWSSERMEKVISALEIRDLVIAAAETLYTGSYNPKANEIFGDRKDE